MKSRRVALFLLVGTLFFRVACYGQTSDMGAVRETFYNGDYYQATELATKLYAKHPDDATLRGWFAVLARPGATQDALSAMRKSDPEGAWTLLAQLSRVSPWEVKSLCNAAIVKAPEDVDVLVLATRKMKNSLYAATDHEQSVAFRANLAEFLTSHAPAYEKSAHGLAVRASAELALSENETESKKAAQNSEITGFSDHALHLDPNEVQALLVKAEILTRKGEKQASYELLREAVPANLNSIALRSAYWKALLNAPKLSKQEQGKAILEDVKSVLDHGEPTHGMVSTMIYGAEAAGSSTVASIEEMIAKRYPNTIASDTVLYMQATQDDPAIASDPNTPEKVQAIEEYLDRPLHPDPDTVEQARRQLLSVMSKQAKPDLDRTYKELMALQGDDVDGIAILAEHQVHLPELQQIAEKHLDNEWGPFVRRTLDQSDKTGFLDFSLSYFVSPWQSVLGLVYLNEGKLNEAQEKLEAAIAIDPNDLHTSLRLGQVYEAKGENVQAEKTYMAALSEVSVSPDEHPAIAALRKNYQRQHPDSAGLDQYLQVIVQKDSARRKAAVLGARNASPKTLPTFTMKTLDGKTVTSAETKGKVVVINFWATWCGPCRKELPDYEKLYQEYSKDPAVMIVTIATDSPDTPVQTIETYIHSHNFTFPVLLGSSYATENEATPIPMTWFISPDGKEVYRKVGFTKELVQEFGWRIESLREAPAKAPGAGN